jgi:hypothetical protein
MSASGGDAGFYEARSTKNLHAVNLALPYFQLLATVPNILMNRTISTAALFATALLMTGCLDPAPRRSRSAYTDTRTNYDERGDDRRHRDRDDDRDRDDADDTAAAGDTATPPPPTDADQPAPTTTNVIPPIPTGPVPYAIKAPGKPGFVTSPFAEGKLIDVRGLPPGTEFECPYTKRPIQVP